MRKKTTMSEIKQVSFRASIKDKWFKFNGTNLPKGMKCIDADCNEIKGTGSTENIPISCSTNNSYSARTGEISFRQDESGYTGKTIVTQAGKACDCEAYRIDITRNIIPSTGGKVNVGTITSESACVNKVDVDFKLSCSETYAVPSVEQSDINKYTIFIQVNANTGDSRNFNLIWKYGNNECSSETFMQEGKTIQCDCNDVDLICEEISTPIPSEGTGNEYIKMASYSYTGGGSCPITVVTAYTIEQNASISARTSDKTIWLKVGANPSNSQRTITLNFQYKLNGVLCPNELKFKCPVLQEGRTVITCDCEDDVDFQCKYSGNFPQSGVTAFTRIATISSLTDSCNLTEVTCTTNYSDDVTIQVNGSSTFSIFAKVNANTLTEDRNITFSISYKIGDKVCTNKKSCTVTQDKFVPVVECCNNISNVTKVLTDIIPTTGITDCTALTFTKLADAECDSDFNINVDRPDVNYTSGQTSSQNGYYTKFNSVAPFTGINANSTINVELKYDDDTPCSKNGFTQKGCWCSEIEVVSADTVPIDRSGPVTFAKYKIPEGCETPIENGNYETTVFHPNVNSTHQALHDDEHIYIYYKDTQGNKHRYEKYNKIMPNVIRFSGDTYYNIICDFMGNSNYDDEVLYLHFEFKECDTSQYTYDVPFKVYKTNVSKILMMPLMYRYAKEEIDDCMPSSTDPEDKHYKYYPFTSVTSGTSAVYAPVGYLVTSTTVSNVLDVVKNDKFVSFDEPITDYVYHYLQGTELVFNRNGNNNSDNVLINDKYNNIGPIRYVRGYEKYQELIDGGLNPHDDDDYAKIKRLCNTDVEKLIVANQFFYDYGEKTSYNYENSTVTSQDTLTDLKLTDNIYFWNWNGIDKTTPIRDVYSVPVEDGVYYDTILEEALCAVNHDTTTCKTTNLGNDNFVNRTVCIDIDDDTEKYVYIVYSQGLDLDTSDISEEEGEQYNNVYHQYLFPYEHYKYYIQEPTLWECRRRIKQTNGKNIAYADNLKVTLRTLTKQQQHSFFDYYVNGECLSTSSGEVRFDSSDMEDFKYNYSGDYQNGFRKISWYLSSNENEKIHYNFMPHSSLNETSKIELNVSGTSSSSYSFKQFPLHLFKHNNQNSFDYYSTNHINLTSIDDRITVGSLGNDSYIDFRAYWIDGNRFVNLANVTYYTSTYDDDASGHVASCEETTCDAIGIDNIPLFITLSGIKFDTSESLPDCDTSETSIFKQDIFVSKNLKKIKIMCNIDQIGNLYITEIRTNILNPNDNWNWG